MSEKPCGSKETGAVGRHSDVPVPTVAKVHVERLRSNLRYMRELARPAEVMAVVKANAYGHGIEHIVPVLEQEGVKKFAVATAAEGVALREMDVEGEILVMGGVLPETLAVYCRYDLAAAVSSASELELIDQFTSQGTSLRVHVNVDTGMARLGLDLEEASEVVSRLGRMAGVEVRGVWSHFATADERPSPVVQEQWSRFKRVVDRLRRTCDVPALHMANSAALFYHRESLDMPCTMVRVGLGLYGYAPSAAEGRDERLQPVMDLWSRIVHVKTIAGGTSVSYNHTWKAPGRTRIATLGAGYGDGYRRALSNRAQVRIHDSLYPVVGNVCMDMTMVDLGSPADLSGPQTAAVGDRALLFGAAGPTAHDVARWAETIPYEILCGISQRVPRQVYECD